jgi:4-alpha-glucanotransferase
MYVLEIELREDAQQPFTPAKRRSVASLGTHDLPPFAAFWQGSDVEQRVELGVLEAKQATRELSQRRKQIKALSAYLRKRGLAKKNEASQALQGSLAVLADGAARRVIVNLEDLWLEERPQNVPGTTGEQYPSWRRRAKYGLDELEAGVPSVDEALQLLRTKRPRKRGLKS